MQGAARSPQFCCQRRQLWIPREADCDANDANLRSCEVCTYGLKSEGHRKIPSTKACFAVSKEINSVGFGTRAIRPVQLEKSHEISTEGKEM